MNLRLRSLGIVLATFFLSVAVPAFSAVERFNVAQLPSCSDGGPLLVLVRDGASSTDCSTGGGETEVVCSCLDGTWAAVGSGGGGNSFETINAPAGTDPAADSSTDTLNLTSTDLTITGTSGTDTLDFEISNVPLSTATVTGSGSASKAARFDSSHHLVEASLDVQSYTGAPYGEYDPNRPPSSCAVCDEFTGDTETQTWTCAGNTDATKTDVLDSLRIVVTGDSTAIDRYICTTAAPAGSFVMSAKSSVALHNSGVPMCGLVVIRAGTQTVPTSLSQLITYSTASVKSVIGQTATSLTSATSNIANAITFDTCQGCGEAVYYQIRYDAAADTLTYCSSHDGLSAINCAVQTSVTSDPLYLGFLADDLVNISGAVATDCLFDFIRVRTDATGLADPYPSGE